MRGKKFCPSTYSSTEAEVVGARLTAKSSRSTLGLLTMRVATVWESPAGTASGGGG